MAGAWVVLDHPEFARERETLSLAVKEKLTEVINALMEAGPELGRPLVDTLKGSMHKNMKEIRFNADGVWRFAFAFDPERQAVILVGGDKEGQQQSRFYKALIQVADQRFDEWLESEN
nr:type II toxin-antitoxin system RelE/ParE family toxin [uncultured Devosia sp.]